MYDRKLIPNASENRYFVYDSSETFGFLASPTLWVRLPNKRVSSFGASHLRPNPRYARTSDTRQPLSEIGGKGLLEV